MLAAAARCIPFNLSYTQYSINLGKDANVTNIQSFTLFLFIMGFCVLHNVHAATARFMIRTQLVQGLQVRSDAQDNTIENDIADKNAVAARLSVANTGTISTHMQIPQTSITARCTQGQCTGGQVVLDHLRLSQQTIHHQQRYQLHAFEQVALGDKPGNYNATAIVELNAA